MQIKTSSLLPTKYPTTFSDKHPPISKKHSASNLNVQIMPNSPNFESQSKKPKWNNKVGGSAINNFLDDEYARSSTSINSNHMHSAEHRSTKSFRNIETDLLDNDPEKEEDWKGKYEVLYKNYEQVAEKYESKTREGLKMQSTITSQAKTIEKLQEEIFELNNRLMDSESNRNQKSNNSFNTHHSSEFSYGGGVQANRFYVEELERSIDSLQRENKRLSETLMRKFKNSFGY